MIRPDPPVRKDKKCVVCRGDRDPSRSRKYGQDVAADDPFCSTACCKAWHGTSTDSPMTRPFDEGWA